MDMTVTLEGPMWLVKGAPGTADYSRFYKTAADSGFIFTDPNAAKAQPGQSKAMAEVYRQIASLGGIPYEQTMNIKMSGSGPMGGLMGRMGNLTITNTVDSIDTGALADAMFAPPPDFKLNIKK
jgi:hypothetical protein